MFLDGELGKQLFMGFCGFCAGIVVAAGIFAFLAIIGVMTRLIGKTKTLHHIALYEMVLILGGSIGNIIDLFDLSLPWAGTWLLVLAGIGSGIFTGCLFMSLAESLKALPVMMRRIRLADGLQYMIGCIAIGKMSGSLLFYMLKIGLKS